MARFTTSDGLSLYFDDQGQGKPLLCLPGLTRNMDDFEPVLDSFADRARIIRLDLRGRGGSDFDPEWKNYSVPRESLDVVELLDHMGLEKTAILGTSRGGLIAMALGVAHRDRLTGVLLNDIGPVIEPVGLDVIMTYLGAPPPFPTMEEAIAGLPDSMAPAFANITPAGWAAYARRLWKIGADGRLALRYDPHLRDAALQQPLDVPIPDLWPLFETLKGLPLGLIRGANSDLLSVETATRMRQLCPEMIFAEVPDRGHVPFLDEPEAVDLISRFLEMLP